MSKHQNKQFIFAAKLADIKAGTIKKVCFPNFGPILLANVEDKIFAVDDTCTHEDSSLALGCLRGELVKCTLHGSWFSVVTGAPTEEPADEPLNTYEVEIRNNEIWVCQSPASQ